MHTSVVLLINLGSPEGPSTKHLRSYLTEFLMDQRVIDVPLWLRTLLVKGIIVPFRSSKSAGKYKSIWTKEGSPLMTHTKNQCDLLKRTIDTPIYYGMRYGFPSVVSVLKRIHDENPLLNDIIVFPLYPHYAMSSFETAVEQVKLFHAAGNFNSALHIIPPFYNHSAYIRVLTESIKPYTKDPFDHVLFSYHGIPERHIRKTDCTKMHCLRDIHCCNATSPAHAYCYRHQVITTTNLVAKLLNLNTDQFSFSFQSRLGRDAWLKPYTVGQLRDFPAKGIKRLLIVCPAFVSDCLETLEEIAIEGKEEFLKHGGESFIMIPALNENAAWIECMKELVMQRQSANSTKYSTQT